MILDDVFSHHSISLNLIYPPFKYITFTSLFSILILLPLSQMTFYHLPVIYTVFLHHSHTPHIYNVLKSSHFLYPTPPNHISHILQISKWNASQYIMSVPPYRPGSPRRSTHASGVPVPTSRMNHHPRHYSSFTSDTISDKNPHLPATRGFSPPCNVINVSDSDMRSSVSVASSVPLPSLPPPPPPRTTSLHPSAHFPTRCMSYTAYRSPHHTVIGHPSQLSMVRSKFHYFTYLRIPFIIVFISHQFHLQSRI